MRPARSPHNPRRGPSHTRAPTPPFHHPRDRRLASLLSYVQSRHPRARAPPPNVRCARRTCGGEGAVGVTRARDRGHGAQCETRVSWRGRNPSPPPTHPPHPPTAPTPTPPHAPSRAASCRPRSYSRLRAAARGAKQSRTTPTPARSSSSRRPSRALRAQQPRPSPAMARIYLLHLLTLLGALVGVSAGLWCNAGTTIVDKVRWCGRLLLWEGCDGEEPRLHKIGTVRGCARTSPR